MINGQIDTQPQSEIVWRPQAGPQKALVDCSVPEVFLAARAAEGRPTACSGSGRSKNVGSDQASIVCSTGATASRQRACGRVGGTGESILMDDQG
jgi:hypothetical protein